MNIKLKQKDLSFLHSIAEYGLVTIRQISALERIGLRAANKRVKALYDAGLVNSKQRGFSSSKGRPELVISLSEKGARILQSESGIDPVIPIDQLTGVAITHIEHQLLINWVIIHLLHIERKIPSLSVSFYSSTTPFLPRRKDGRPLISDSVKIGDEEVRFIPDGAFSIASNDRGKRLLFFLEVDLSTESLTSQSAGNDLEKKLLKYREYFRSGGYKRYQKAWDCQFNGFRLLVIANSSRRMEGISRLVRDMPSSDFVWVTDQEHMFIHGLSAKIWARGGHTDQPLHSILGPTLACESPLTI